MIFKKKLQRIMTITHLFPSDELIIKLEPHVGISLLSSCPDGVNKVKKSVHGIENSGRLSGISFRKLLRRKTLFKISQQK